MIDILVERLQHTPLHTRQIALGAKMVPFGGWELPVQYTSIVSEHQAVRKQFGVFDVSHMGEFLVSGPGAAAYLAELVPGNVLELPGERALYTQFTNERGGVIDDLLLYRLQDHYLLIVNAANRAKDWEHLQARLPVRGVMLSDASEHTALLALQGPRAAELLAEIAKPDPRTVPFFGLIQGTVLGRDAIMARTGYTGEDGFEIVLANDALGVIWDELLARNVTPCGLGARDTLRLEAGLPLYGHEWDEETTPVEAGLAWTIKSRVPYLGKAVIDRQLQNGTSRQLIGLRLSGKAPAREGYEVWRDDQLIGKIASGSFSPTLGHPVATAYVPVAVKVGELLHVKIRDKLAPAEVVKMPFYRRPRS